MHRHHERIPAFRLLRLVQQEPVREVHDQGVLRALASFGKALRLGRYPMKLIDQARAWGVTPPAKA